MSVISGLLRHTFGRSDAARDAGLTTPEDMLRCDNIAYGDDPRWQVLDVYRPNTGVQAPLPVIVSVHGGGWVYGDKKTYQFYCMSLAQRGFAVVNFSYRLAPEHRFPAQLEDTCAVFRWVLDHAEVYGIDTGHVFAVGDSAGANLLGLFCAACADPDYARQWGLKPPQGFLPTAIALNCGQYRVEPKILPVDLTHLLLRDFLPGRGHPEELEAIDVTAHVSPAFPPTFLMTANGDFLRRQAPILAEVFRARGVPFVYRCYGDAQNKLGHVFHCDIKSPAAGQCNDDECDYFRSFLL